MELAQKVGHVQVGATALIEIKQEPAQILIPAEQILLVQHYYNHVV